MGEAGDERGRSGRGDEVKRYGKQKVGMWQNRSEWKDTESLIRPQNVLISN